MQPVIAPVFSNSMKIVDPIRSAFKPEPKQAPALSATITSQTMKKKQPKRKVKPGTDASRQEAVRLIKSAILVSGYKVVTVTNLLRSFGYQKRSEANMQLLTAWLADEHLTIHPRLSLQLKLSYSLRVYGFPVAQLGDLFESEDAETTPKARQQREKDLEEYIKNNNLFPLLGLIEEAKQQFSPKQTRDRFDFLCKDTHGSHVVLELKHQGGGKSAVEQVLRYLGMLKQEYPGEKARGILVTGIRDVDTAKALHGMTPEQQQEIEWYLYHYNKSAGTINFELVGYDFIDHHLNFSHR